MECTQAENLINAWIDGQIDADDRAALEAHLATCDSCRAESQAAQIQDGVLLRAFQPSRDSSARVAQRVLEAWQDEIAVQLKPAPSSTSASILKRLSYPLTAVVGFLAAVLLFQPWNTTPSPIESETIVQESTRVATLVVSTGDIEVRNPDANAWQTVSESSKFQCSPGSSVRTADDVQCELQTTEGCVIRLNGSSEVSLASSRHVQLQKGQLWCSSPDDITLQVSVQDESYNGKPDEPKTSNSDNKTSLTASCTANSSLLTAIQEQGDIQVTSAQGEIFVQTPQAKQQLDHGETARIVKGEIIKDSTIDSILAGRWIQSLLIKKGDSDAELSGRVDQLLAQIGRSKISTLYEQEIRSLGEHCVLPLLRYTQSPISMKEPRRRIAAVRIVADLAPSWAISDLINLLADTDPTVRFHTATALLRLTSQDQGRSPEQWREPLADCAESYGRWQLWQSKNRELYPNPANVVKAKSIAPNYRKKKI